MQESIHDWPDLLTKYLQGTITPTEMEELNSQIKTSPAKKEQFAKLSDPDLFSEELRELYTIDTGAAWKKLTAEIPKLKEGVLASIYHKPYFKFIAGCLVLGVVTLVYYLSKRQEINYVYLRVNNKIMNLEARTDRSTPNFCYIVLTKRGMTATIKNALPAELPPCSVFSLVTPKDKIFRIELSDGSVVTLNASSILTFPSVFNGNQRHVILSGEAYFKVNHSKKIPFIISTPYQTKIEAAGTELNVKAYIDSGLKTTPFEGELTVTSNDTIFWMKPGQQALLREEKIFVSEGVNIEEARAWTKKFKSAE